MSDDIEYEDLVLGTDGDEIQLRRNESQVVEVYCLGYGEQLTLKRQRKPLLEDILGYLKEYVRIYSDWPALDESVSEAKVLIERMEKRGVAGDGSG